MEDVVYLFALNSSNVEDYRLSREMLTAWTNFAKTGSPGGLKGKEEGKEVQWTQAIAKGKDSNEAAADSFTSHMELSFEHGFKMVPNYFKDVCNAFWKPKIFV